MSSSTRQLQQLTFFNDHSIIPDPKSRTASENETLVGLISESPGTSSAWLVATLIENSIQGTANHVNSELTKRREKNSTVFVSFKRSIEFYSKLCKRNGVDLESIKEFKYVDLFTDLFVKYVPNVASNTTSSDITRMFDAVINKDIPKDNAPVIFIEYPEILLLSTSITSNELLAQIDRLSRLSSCIFILVSTDRELIDLSLTDANDPIFKVSDFFAKLYRRSNINVYCQPLATGRANDLTGIITISRGTRSFSSRTVAARDYLYHINRDGNVKLYLR